jgi:hypothetical protein
MFQNDIALIQPDIALICCEACYVLRREFLRRRIHVGDEPGFHYVA